MKNERNKQKKVVFKSAPEKGKSTSLPSTNQSPFRCFRPKCHFYRLRFLIVKFLVFLNLYPLCHSKPSNDELHLRRTRRTRSVEVYSVYEPEEQNQSLSRELSTKESTKESQTFVVKAEVHAGGHDSEVRQVTPLLEEATALSDPKGISAILQSPHKKNFLRALPTKSYQHYSYSSHYNTQKKHFITPEQQFTPLSPAPNDSLQPRLKFPKTNTKPDISAYEYSKYEEDLEYWNQPHCSKYSPPSRPRYVRNPLTKHLQETERELKSEEERNSFPDRLSSRNWRQFQDRRGFQPDRYKRLLSDIHYRPDYFLINLYELPEEYFRRTTEERFEERYPSPSPQYLLHSRPRLRRPGCNPYSEQLMGRMNPLEDHERKVIIEFCHLLEKSKQLFNGLRELPQYGHKQWHSYFGRTFDVYTKLWKFQQQHRAILDSKYGLKRWQIGEIASKIGQLYYHFYLRTSETAYLNEAYSFYYAIRGRSYYTKACKEDKCELMVKKLRFYARFIVVCLLLKKLKLVRELIKELDRQIIEYGNTYDPDDQVEWTVVVDEVKAFIQAEPVVSVINPDNYPVILSHRLSSLNTPPVDRSPQINLTLQEVLIVGSIATQVKFSELTIDMYRMLQTLEREPSAELPHLYDDSPRQHLPGTPSALNTKGYNLESGPRCNNPHKYLLFKPSLSQILVYLASGCDDLLSNSVLLFYISADGQIVQPTKHPEDVGYDVGGLITTSKNDIYREFKQEQKPKYKDPQCLHPGDLYPFTRRPLFVIVESDNSYAFQNIPKHFAQPLVVLMSPLETPTSLHATAADRRHGSLFTLFLHSPLTAFCHTCDIHNIAVAHWDRAQAYIDTFMVESVQIISRTRIDPMFISFMGDDFLRLLILRFIFCEVTLSMHRAFRARTHRTRSLPALPVDLLEHPSLIHIVMDLASHLQVRGNFHDPSGAGLPPPKE